MTDKNFIKRYPTIACCGIDCGMCPTYYSKAISKCVGCCGNGFSNNHPSCSIITCCVKKKNLETCAECEDFPCSKLKDWDTVDSFVSHRKSISNLKNIKNQGIEDFIQQQKIRMGILKLMLNNFNEGRSKSFYCIASTLLPIHTLQESLMKCKERIISEKVLDEEIKTKAKILKEILNEKAKIEGVNLKLRKK